jgi:hypothetical protein
MGREAPRSRKYDSCIAHKENRYGKLPGDGLLFLHGVNQFVVEEALEVPTGIIPTRLRSQVPTQAHGRAGRSSSRSGRHGWEGIGVHPDLPWLHRGNGIYLGLRPHGRYGNFRGVH